MDWKDPRVRRTCLLLAPTFTALNAGMGLARWDSGLGTGLTAWSAALGMIATILFLTAGLWDLWKNGAPPP
ncbi:MAG: hypothetical protein ACLPSW_19185 [Roseiarcus sp.]|jgi:hypothetical protein